MNRDPTIRKLAGGFLLLLGFLPIGWGIILQCRKWFIQHEMKERLEQQALHSICLKKGSFEWVDNGREIKTNGKMFDVKTSYEDAGLFYFTGLFDEEEDAIEEKIKNNKGSQPAAVIVFNWTSQLLFQDLNADYKKLWNISLKGYPIAIISGNKDPVADIRIPPPKSFHV